MRKYIYSFLLFLSLCMGLRGLHAQSYPVQATFQLVPPYSLYLSDYAAVDNNKIALNLLLKDLNKQDLQARLKLTIEGVGITITTRPDYRPQPLYLQGGLPEMLGAADLAPYFSPENLIFQGISRDRLTKGNALPEGFYRISFQLLEYNLGAEVSNIASASAWLMLNDPPMINLPMNGEKVRAQEPQTVLFQWTPRHTGSPNAAFATEYEFQLVELWPEGRDPNNAIQSTPPIFETTTYSTSLIYGLAEPPLVPGRHYAFRVRAKAMSGIEQLDLFKNNGYSQVHSFVYGDACTPPTVVEASTVSSTRIKVSWQAEPYQTQFTVYYREKDSDEEWQTQSTYLNEATIDGLTPDREYEFQVSAFCGSIDGGRTATVTSATSQIPVTNYTCGADPGAIDLENKNPLQQLEYGQTFKAGDIDVRVINVEGSNGYYTGKGHAQMPWLNNVKVRVIFENIYINTDYQMIRGTVKTVFNANSPMVFDLDGDGVLQEDGGSDDATPPFEGTTIEVDGVIASVSISDAGDIIIEKEDGTTKTITPEKDEATGENIPTQITDEAGNTYTVDKDGNVTKGAGSAGGGESNSVDANELDDLGKLILSIVNERILQRSTEDKTLAAQVKLANQDLVKTTIDINKIDTKAYSSNLSVENIEVSSVTVTESDYSDLTSKLPELDTYSQASSAYFKDLLQYQSNKLAWQYLLSSKEKDAFISFQQKIADSIKAVYSTYADFEKEKEEVQKAFITERIKELETAKVNEILD